ncbi:MAG: tetratricopeptide repeat protein [Alphaproteobacteria bacterium]|nr:tetratricopeptide repeat protein [Alphaproteobacteria bacterium]MBV9063382.1 tetratricopeptide repeat protein [Alphaproteobacteria bacterium]
MNRPISFQKSHDWDFSLDRNLPDALYVVQYRHPVPEALSDRDLAMQDKLDKSSLNYRRTSDSYSWWLAHKAIYYRRFHDKWFRRRVPNAVYLNYDDLLRDPVGQIAGIVDWVDGSTDSERLSQSISEIGGGRTFTPRVIEASAYFDQALLAPFEAYVIERCPIFEFRAELSGSYRNSEFHGLIIAQDPEEPLPDGETDRLEAAAKLAPGHPEISLRLAEREFQRGAPDKAIEIIQGLLERNPFFSGAYRLLMQICRGAGKPLPDFACRADAIFACHNYPDILVGISDALLREKRWVNALSVLGVTTVLFPEHARANFLLAKTLVQEGRWAQARAYAEKALKLEPQNDKFAGLNSRIVTHFSEKAA